MKICAESDCEREAKARGLCFRHYNRHHRNGTLPPPPTDWERFMDRVIIDETTGCWNWSGKKQMSGHALFRIDGRVVSAYRWAYEQIHGPVDADLVMDHFVCHRGAESCANPHHVRPETRSANAADNAWARKTHCPHGHEYTPDNTILYAGPHGRRTRRRCRVCALLRGREYHERRGRALRASRKKERP